MSRATLHNRDFIRQLDARVGDIVSVRKAGEIIPEIIGVEKDRRPLDSVPYEFPKFCPVCGAPVYDDEDEAAIRCTSASCPAQLLRNLMHFASREDVYKRQGKGRCNVCNNCDVQEVLRNVPVNPRFLYSALGGFGPADEMCIRDRSIGEPEGQ